MSPDLCVNHLEALINLPDGCVRMQLGVCHWQNLQTAVPKSADCHPGSFSEGRAMQIVEGLADEMPHRQVCWQDPIHFLVGGQLSSTCPMLCSLHATWRSQMT